MEIKGNSINFYGIKEEIQNAKLKITSLTNRKIKDHLTNFEKQVEVAKNIQWKYESLRDGWKDFSYSLNSLIESSHAAHKSHVEFSSHLFFLPNSIKFINNFQFKINFKDEDNNNCIVYFNVNPMIYRIGTTNVKIKREDIEKGFNTNMVF